MKPLVWTGLETPVTAWWGGPDMSWRHATGDGSSSEATAKSNAETAFAAAGSEAPVSSAIAADAWIQGGGSPPWYVGFLGRIQSRGVWAVPDATDPLTYDVDLYGLPVTQAGVTFDGNGDFPAVDVLHKWYSEAGVTVRTDSSDTLLGSDSTPPALPASTPGHSGYLSTLMVAVVKWHFDYTA